VTTTAPRLHPENETRLLSLGVKDTPTQTKAIPHAPSAERLAELVAPVAVRLRRDFRLLLTMIEAHALLHRDQRERDNRGRIVATLRNYDVVRELVADLFAEGVDATVKPETRETVAAVAALKQALGKDEVSQAEIAEQLKLDRGAVSRRVAQAVSCGYLLNNETGKGRPARITLGDSLPAEIEILPDPARLSDCCTVAPLQRGMDTPVLPHRRKCRLGRDRHMSAKAADLLVEIRRSGDDVRLVACDRLKLVAPTALLPELAARVRAAKQALIVALSTAGQQAPREGGEGESNPLRNGATAQHLSWHQTISTPAADWRARYREALAHWGALHPDDEAASIAWGEMQVRWHRLHGARVPASQCCGCGDPIGDRKALDLADGRRAHLDTFDCLIAYGARWRRAATEALAALGLQPPAAARDEPRVSG
jgi:biotin operon repressor